MSTESQTIKLNSEGVPRDSFSLENSLMVFNTARTPLLIDPNGNGLEWLKRHFSQVKDLEIVNQNDTNFNTVLETAVKSGKIMIIQEIEYIDSVLFSLLRKDIMIK